MKIVKIMYKTKCDIPGCKNLASNSICDEVDSNKKLSLCDECFNSLYQAISKVVTPKSIDAPFKNQKKLR